MHYELVFCNFNLRCLMNGTKISLIFFKIAHIVDVYLHLSILTLFFEIVGDGYSLMIPNIPTQDNLKRKKKDSCGKKCLEKLGAFLVVGMLLEVYSKAVRNED